MSSHIVDGKFQSDKYPTCPAGKVPLSVTDPTAQDLLWQYAQRRRAVDAQFADDLEACLLAAGFRPPLMRREMFARAADLLRARAARDRGEALNTHGIAPWPESHKQKLRESAARDDAFAMTLESECGLPKEAP